MPLHAIQGPGKPPEMRCSNAVLMMARIINMNGAVKEPNKFHNYETEKITCGDAVEYI